MAVGTNGCWFSCRFRFTSAKVRIIGAAEGSIMAIIISVHMRNKCRSDAVDHGSKSGPDIFIPAQQHTPVSVIARASWIMSPQAIALTETSTASTTQRSRSRMASTVGLIGVLDAGDEPSLVGPGEGQSVDGRAHLL